jgi:hypothetical protein
VGRHNHSLLGSSIPAGDPHGISPFLASQRVPTGYPHGLVHTPSSQAWQWLLIPFVTTHPNDTILSAFGSLSQEVTHLGTTIPETRLTAEF